MKTVVYKVGSGTPRKIVELTGPLALFYVFFLFPLEI